MNDGWQIQQIFSIPVGNEFGFDDDNKVFMIYSPLTTKFQLLTEQESEKLKTDLLNNNCSSEFVPFTGGKLPSQRPGYHASYHDFTTLYILLNQRCNFSCTYCYSSQGRSNQELTFEQLKNMLDFFFSGECSAENYRRIIFAGGGEPLLAWDLLKSGVLYAKQLSTEMGKEISFDIVSNTSLFDDDKIDFISKNNIGVKSSFDILPHIQESQRGHYEVVAANLKKLLSAGIYTNIQTTVTPASVSEIENMMKEIVSKFPEVKSVTLEAVYSAEMLKDKEAVDDFMKKFYSGYLAAEKVAEDGGIKIFSTLFATFNIIRDRYCGGQFVLTPEGKLSLCVHVSSPNEAGYQNMLFGSVNNGRVEIDEEKSAEFLNATVEKRERCRNCFARWNCGGGCPDAHRIYTQEILDALCENTRWYLKKELIRQMEKFFYLENRQSLKNFLHQSLG